MNNDVPTHIGFIVDGNRRWAKEHGLPAYEGHLAGYNAMQDVLLETLHRGVNYASAYVFSTENWKRSEDEVRRIMKLLRKLAEAVGALELERDSLRHGTVRPEVARTAHGHGPSG